MDWRKKAKEVIMEEDRLFEIRRQEGLRWLERKAIKKIKRKLKWNVLKDTDIVLEQKGGEVIIDGELKFHWDACHTTRSRPHLECKTPCGKCSESYGDFFEVDGWADIGRRMRNSSCESCTIKSIQEEWGMDENSAMDYYASTRRK